MSPPTQRLNRTAASYPTADLIPQEVGQRLLERLAFIKQDPARIVDLGAGCGRLLPGLQSLYPQAELLAVDLALGRLQHARQQARCEVLTAHHQQLPLADHSVDLLLANLSLHECLDVTALFAEFHRVLKPEGCLLFATVGPDTLQQLRLAFAEVDDHPHVQGFFDMHDLGDALLRQGFENPVMDAEFLTVEYQDARQLLTDLKAMGENAVPDRTPGLMGKGRWQAFLQALDRQRTAAGRLPITVEVIYGHAWSPVQKTVLNTEGEFRMAVSEIPIRRRS